MPTTTVVPTPPAKTPKDHSSVLANLDSLEMEPVVLVSITYLNFLRSDRFSDISHVD